jgi:TPR repeat protein
MSVTIAESGHLLDWRSYPTLEPLNADRGLFKLSNPYEQLFLMQYPPLESDADQYRYAAEAEFTFRLLHPALEPLVFFSVADPAAPRRPTSMMDYPCTPALAYEYRNARLCDLPPDKSWQVTQAQIFLLGVASAMRYLAGKGLSDFVLDAEHVFVTEKLRPKVAGYGIATVFHGDHTANQPDAVAAYGVLADVVLGRLSHPRSSVVPEALEQLLRQCNSSVLSDRPSFADIELNLQNTAFHLASLNVEEYRLYISWLELADLFPMDNFMELSNSQRQLLKKAMAGKTVDSCEISGTKIESSPDDSNSASGFDSLSLTASDEPKTGPADALLGLAMAKGNSDWGKNYRAALWLLTRASLHYQKDSHATYRSESTENNLTNDWNAIRSLAGIPAWFAEQPWVCRAHAKVHPLKWYSFMGKSNLFWVPSKLLAMANGDEPEAILSIANSLLEGAFHSLKQESGFLYLKSRIEIGDARLQTALARCYEKGIGTIVNPTKAAAWYRKAGDEPSAIRCDRSLEDINAQLSRLIESSEEARRVIAAADTGDPLACLQAGCSFLYGLNSFPNSQQEALKYYVLGGTISADIYCVLGDLFRKEMGFPMLLRKAVKFYHLAHLNGSRRGQWMDSFYNLHKYQQHEKKDQSLLRFLDNHFGENLDSWGMDDCLIPALAEHMQMTSAPFSPLFPIVGCKATLAKSPDSPKGRLSPGASYFFPTINNDFPEDILDHSHWISAWRYRVWSLLKDSNPPGDIACWLYGLCHTFAAFDHHGLLLPDMQIRYFCVNDRDPMWMISNMNNPVPNGRNRPARTHSPEFHAQRNRMCKRIKKIYDSDISDVDFSRLANAESFEQFLALLEEGILVVDPIKMPNFRAHISKVRSTRAWSTPSVVFSPMVKAADAGIVEEQLKVGFSYLHADGGFPLNYGLAACYYKMAADAEDPEGECMYGCLRARGLGVSQSSGDALDILYRAACRPNASSKVKVRYALFTEWFIRVNNLRFDPFPRPFSKFLHEAALANDPDASYHLGRLAESKESERVGGRKAIPFYEAAARRGHLGALYRLFLIYHHQGNTAEIYRLSPYLMGLSDAGLLVKLVDHLRKGDLAKTADHFLDQVKSVNDSIGLVWVERMVQRDDLTAERIEVAKHLALRTLTKNPKALALFTTIIFKFNSDESTPAQKLKQAIQYYSYADRKCTRSAEVPMAIAFAEVLVKYGHRDEASVVYGEFLSQASPTVLHEFGSQLLGSQSQKSQKQGFGLLKQALSQGHIKSAFVLGTWFYQKGDVEDALVLLEKASRQGSAAQLFDYASIRRRNGGPRDKEDEFAIFLAIATIDPADMDESPEAEAVKLREMQFAIHQTPLTDLQRHEIIRFREIMQLFGQEQTLTVIRSEKERENERRASEALCLCCGEEYKFEQYAHAKMLRQRWQEYNLPALLNDSELWFNIAKENGLGRAKRHWKGIANERRRAEKETEPAVA